MNKEVSKHVMGLLETLGIDPMVALAINITPEKVVVTKVIINENYVKTKDADGNNVTETVVFDV